jgi:hypothetical protein
VINFKPLRSASNPPTSYQGLSDSQTFFCRFFFALQGEKEPTKSCPPHHLARASYLFESPLLEKRGVARLPAPRRHEHFTSERREKYNIPMRFTRSREDAKDS